MRKRQARADPELRARPHVAHRRVVGRRAPHAWRHAVRWPRAPAAAAHPRRGHVDARPADRGEGCRSAAAAAPAAGHRGRLRGRRVGHRHRRPVRHAAGYRSPRSTWRARSSRFSYRSSAGRPRSSCRSTRSRSSPRRALTGCTGQPHGVGPGPEEGRPLRRRSPASSSSRSRPAGQPRPARRPRARSARRQHHGVLQGVQRRDGVAAWQRRPRRDHGVRRPFVHVHHQDPAGRRAHQEGRRRPQGLRRPRTPSRSAR